MIAPFRLGTTSFIYPDRWLGNVERLAGRVDDVEILLLDVLIERYRGVVTLEVFREADFEESLAVIQRWLAEGRG